MAIDSAAKRFSMLQVRRHRGIVVPDGTIDSGDRLTLLGRYSGIPAESTSSTPSPSSSGADYQFSRWNGSAWKRITFPTHWITNISPCETLEIGGFGQCTVSSLLTWEEMSLVGGERIDIFLFGVRIYRGIVRVPDMRISSDRQEVSIQCFGLMERTDRLIVECMYAFGERVDISQIAERVFDDHVNGADRLPNVVKIVEPIGVTSDRFDGRGKTATEAWNAICALAPNQAIWQFRVNTAGQDVWYFGPRPSAIINYFTIGGAPNGERSAVDFSYPRDLGKIVNSVNKLEGGKVSHPNLVKNGSFETVLPNGETNGNLLGDYSVENNTGGGSASGGASRKGPGDHGGARTGSYWIELDTAGERWTWPAVAIDPSIPLVASWWGRRETAATPRGGKMVVKGLDVSSADVINFQIPSSGLYVDPGSDTYVRYQESVDFSPYPSVTQIVAYVETDSGSAADDGIDIDDVAVFEKGATPEGWTWTKAGAAGRAQLEWQQHTFPADSSGSTETFHGCYGVKVQASGIAVPDTDYLEIKTAQDARVSVRPNNPYTFGIRYRMDNAVSTFPAFKLVIREYKQDGTVAAETLGPEVTAATADWSEVDFGVQTNSDTATAELGIRVRNNEVHYFDAAFLPYGSLPSEILADGGNAGYWESDTYERRARVTNSSLTGLSADALASIDTYGLQEEPLRVESVVDWDTAKALLSDYFNAHAVPEVRGNLVVHPTNTRELLTPTGKVRLINLPDAPNPLSCVRVDYTLTDSDGVTMNAEIGDRRPDMGTLQALVEQRARQGL